MNEDYENIFERFDDQTVYIHENLLDFGVDIFNTQRLNKESDYEIRLDEYIIDKSETKSESKTNRQTDSYMFDANNYYLSLDENSTENKIKNTGEKIFQIVKDFSKANLNCDVTLSERMKTKTEKTKIILGEKKRRTTIEEYDTKIIQDNIAQKDNYNENAFQNRNIDIGGKKKVNKNLDKLKRKQIKILRNRISAQNSRDKQKTELNELRNSSSNLFKENYFLKCKLQDKENEISFINNVIKNCRDCGVYQNNESIEVNKNQTYESLCESSNVNEKIYRSPQILENSFATRNNFNTGRLKIGLVSGLFLFVFLIGCFILSPFENSNDTISKREDNLRNLFSDGYENSTYTSEASIQNKTRKNLSKQRLLELEESTKLAIYPLDDVNSFTEENDQEYYPVVKKSVIMYKNDNDDYLVNDLEFLTNKRYAFLMDLANKKYGDLISKNKKDADKLFLSENVDYPIMEYTKSDYNSKQLTCFDHDKIIYRVKLDSPSMSNYIRISDYFQQIAKKIKNKYLNNNDDLNKLEDEDEYKSSDLMTYDNKNLLEVYDKNVESVLCNNYLGIGTDKTNFEEIFNKKENSVCQYLHLIIPIQNSDSKFTQTIENGHISPPDKKEYFEIGCKIFEINKISK